MVKLFFIGCHFRIFGVIIQWVITRLQEQNLETATFRYEIMNYHVIDSDRCNLEFFILFLKSLFHENQIPCSHYNCIHKSNLPTSIALTFAILGKD